MAVALSGGLAPGGGLSGTYPAAPGPAWPSASTPERRFTIVVGGVTHQVACLDRCATPLPVDFDIDSGNGESPAVASVLTAAGRSGSGLGAASEATAVQAAIWFAAIGFVLDSDADPAIRARTADLVAAADAIDGSGGSMTVLIGGDPGAPRLVVVDEQAGDGPLSVEPRNGAAPPAIVVLDEAPGSSDTASATDTSTTSSGTTTMSSGTNAPSTSTTSTSTTSSSASSTDPTLTSSTATTETTDTTSSVLYENCAAVWAAIGRPLNLDEPGYLPVLDRDGDGVACELDPTYTNPTSSTPATAAAGVAAGGSTPDPLASTGFAAVRALLCGGALVLIGAAMVVVAARAGRPAPNRWPHR